MKTMLGSSPSSLRAANKRGSITIILAGGAMVEWLLLMCSKESLDWEQYLRYCQRYNRGCLE